MPLFALFLLDDLAQKPVQIAHALVQVAHDVLQILAIFAKHLQHAAETLDLALHAVKS